jgi:hypothetical protein
LRRSIIQGVLKKFENLIFKSENIHDDQFESFLILHSFWSALTLYKKSNELEVSSFLDRKELEVKLKNEVSDQT